MVPSTSSTYPVSSRTWRWIGRIATRPGTSGGWLRSHAPSCSTSAVRAFRIASASPASRTEWTTYAPSWTRSARSGRRSSGAQKVVRFREQALEQLGARWGQGAFLGHPMMNPSRASDTAFVEEQGRRERLSTSPGAAVALLRMNFDMAIKSHPRRDRGVRHRSAPGSRAGPHSGHGPVHRHRGLDRACSGAR